MKLALFCIGNNYLFSTQIIYSALVCFSVLSVLFVSEYLPTYVHSIACCCLLLRFVVRCVVNMAASLFCVH